MGLRNVPKNSWEAGFPGGHAASEGGFTLPLSRKKIRTLIQPGLVLDLPPLPKQEALAHLCKAMAADARVLDGEALLQAVLQREEMSSTGIGLGLAIPHVKIPQVTDFILAIGRCREGLE